MITRSPTSNLYTHAIHSLTTARSNSGSWFCQIRELCVLYHLCNPLDLIAQPLSADQFKKLIKSKITDYWEKKLRKEAEILTSTPYFNPNFMSLCKPHPIWTSCGSSLFECNKAVIAARMLSGRYLTDRQQRHWTSNSEGVCLLPECSSSKPEGSLTHLLLFCPSLSHTRDKLMKLIERVSLENEVVSVTLHWVFTQPDTEVLIKFLLDCTSIPRVIHITQAYGNVVQDRLLYVGRTWCYAINRERMNLMGLLKFR